MSQIESLRRCYTCGAVLQSQDPTKEGYIAPETLAAHAEKDVLLCEACYTRRKFNRLPSSVQHDHTFMTMIGDALASGAMIVHIIDLTSFECSFDPRLPRNAVPNHIVIGNKRDLLPASWTDEQLKSYIIYVFQKNGITLKPEEIFLTSLLSSNTDISEIENAIETKRQGHDVYIIGSLGAGKSKFFDAYLRHYKNPSQHPVGVSHYYGTEANVMKVPLDSTSFLYDVPDLAVSNSFLRYKEDAALQRALQTVRPFPARRTGIVKGGSLFIGTLARIDYWDGDSLSLPVTAYFPEKIPLKSVLPKREMNALFVKYLEKKTWKPTLSCLSSMADYDGFELSIEGDEEEEIAIAGLGWIQFRNRGKRMTLRVYVPRGIGIDFGKAKGK